MGGVEWVASWTTSPSQVKDDKPQLLLLVQTRYTLMLYLESQYLLLLVINHIFLLKST